MNIGFDAKRAFHNFRGLGNYSRDTIRVLSHYFPENNYYLFNPKIKKVDFLYGNNVNEVLPQSLLGKLAPSLWRTIGMSTDIERHNIDVFHGLSQELPLGLNRLKTKTVVTMHDAIFMRHPELYSPIYRQIFIQKNKYACKKADHIIAISEQTKSDIIQYFGAKEDRVSVVYQGCNNVFRQDVSEEQKLQIRQKYALPSQFVLYVGAIEKRKNAAIIIEALHRKRCGVPIVMIGKPTEYINEIKKLIVKYDMEEQVVFIHNAETLDLPAIYSLSSLFLYPSVFEGFGIPILEALCTQTPVITSAGSCFAEAGGAESIYVDPMDADGWGEAIVNVLSDVQLQQKMKMAGQQHSLKFTDSHIASNLMNVYQSIY